MNNAKIAAALHALADAFLEGVETVEGAVTGKKGGKKTTTVESAANAPVLVAGSIAGSVVAGTAPVAAPLKTLEPYVAPAAAAPVAPVPTIDKAKLNAAVLKVAAKSRDTAEAILARFGAKNTVTLPAEQWQAVFDAFEEEIAKQDAAAVQVQQASLV
jgi:hypothetical protein